MPMYQFLNTITQEVSEDILTFKQLEKFLKKNPHMTQLLAAPAIGDSIRMGMVKPPDSFRDVLREIKKKNSKGISRSTVNTFD